MTHCADMRYTREFTLHGMAVERMSIHKRVSTKYISWKETLNVNGKQQHHKLRKVKRKQRGEISLR